MSIKSVKYLQESPAVNSEQWTIRGYITCPISRAGRKKQSPNLLVVSSVSAWNFIVKFHKFVYFYTYSYINGN